MRFKPYYCCIFILLVSYIGHTQNQVAKTSSSTNQAYCPQSEIRIAPNFKLKIDSTKNINKISIKISKGYKKDQDMLKLTNALMHLSVSTKWNVTNGELTLTNSDNKPIPTKNWVRAIKDVTYVNNNASVSGKRAFSISLNNEGFENIGKTQVFVPVVTEVLSAERCGPGTLKLTAKAVGDVYWFDSPTLGVALFKGETFITPILKNSKTYYVVAGTEDCLNGERTPIYATVFNMPTAQKKTELINCDIEGESDGYTFFNLKEATDFMTLGYSDDVNITYYLSEADAVTKRNVISNPENFSNENTITAYARIENEAGCYSVADLILKASTTSFPKGYQREITACDGDMLNDGRTAFDLTIAGVEFMEQFPTGQNLEVSYYRSFKDAQLEKNKILNETNYFNKTPFKETLYVRVESKDNGACYGIGAHLTLIVKPRPEFKVNPVATLCLDKDPIELGILEPEDSYRYEWTRNGIFVGNSRTIEIREGGEYNVVAVSTYGCRSTPRTIKVREVNIAVASIEDILIKDGTPNENTISLNNGNLGLGDYEYALGSEDGNYQSQPLFKDVTSGVHTLYIREKHGCGTASIKAFVFEYPQLFTPNNDGKDDFWQITEGLDDISPYTVTNLFIYNQSGQLVAEVNPFDVGWDGKRKGKPMPEGKYSFVITLIDKSGKRQERKGSFKLERS